MAVEREEALKRAVEYVRRGRLEAAIAEYERVARAFPRDWKTLNTLGDLYLRVDQPGEAVRLFARIADHLADEGLVSRASTFYKRILAISPGHAHALAQLDWLDHLDAHAARAVTGDPEVDLSEALNALAGRSVPAADSKGTAMPDSPESPDLDQVFRDFRDEVSRQTEASEAEQQFKLGLTYRDMGMHDDAIRELERAARAPRLRFEASALVARLLRDRGEVVRAIEWYERAVEAPSPTPDAGRELLYELGQALESTREWARALAVYMELRSDAGDYRDVAARIERLNRAQAEN